MLILETPRLILRPFREEDAEAFSAYRSDPQVAHFQGWNAPFTRIQAKAFITHMSNVKPGTAGRWYQFALERKASPGLIGDVAFHRRADDPQQAEIAFTLAREWQHQGYAFEAAECLLEYLFRDLGLHRVTAICDDENYRSVNVLERLGMRREAHAIENVWFKGAWGSEYQYALLEREWWAQNKVEEGK
ncbi:MAG: GNAT family N-acetyltransferase [Anaerolineae bacterium]